MRSSLFLIGLIFFLLSNLKQESFANTYPIQNLKISKFEKDTTYVLPENEAIIKQKLLAELKTFKNISLYALLCIPASLITLGLSLIAGNILFIIAIVYFFLIRAKINNYPGFLDDPKIEKKVYIANIMVGTLIALYGLSYLFFIVLLAELLFFDTINLLGGALFPTMITSILLLFDALVFNTKPK